MLLWRVYRKDRNLVIYNVHNCIPAHWKIQADVWKGIVSLQRRWICWKTVICEFLKVFGSNFLSCFTNYILLPGNSFCPSSEENLNAMTKLSFPIYYSVSINLRKKFIFTHVNISCCLTQWIQALLESKWNAKMLLYTVFQKDGPNMLQLHKNLWTVQWVIKFQKPFYKCSVFPPPAVWI